MTVEGDRRRQVLARHLTEPGAADSDILTAYIEGYSWTEEDEDTRLALCWDCQRRHVVDCLEVVSGRVLCPRCRTCRRTA